MNNGLTALDEGEEVEALASACPQPIKQLFLHNSNPPPPRCSSKRGVEREIVEIEFTDRYQALGIPYPEPETMCGGQCEGTGWVPIHYSEDKEPWRSLWIKAEDKKREQIKMGRLRAVYLIIFKGGEGITDLDDGYHFVKCPDCKGTGKKAS